MTAVFSDSTAGRIGIVTCRSALSITDGASPRPSPPTQIATRPAKVGFEHGSAVARHGRDDEASALPRLTDRLVGGRPYRNREPERTAHRSPQGLPPERIRACPGRDHSRRATRFGGARDGADVSWILYVAGDEHQRRRAREEAIFSVRRTFGDRDDGTGRSNRAGGSHDGRRRRGDIRSVWRDARDQRLDVEPIDGVAGDHDVTKTDPRGSGGGDQVQAVEQHQAGFGALRDRPVARHERVLPAGDPLHISRSGRSALHASRTRAPGPLNRVGGVPRTLREAGDRAAWKHSTVVPLPL